MTQTPIVLTEEEMVNFPTLASYDPEQIGRAIAELMSRGQTRDQAMINLEQDLSEAEA